MADNDTTYQPATGVGNVPVASDDIGGIRYQRVKVTWGVDGAAADTSVTNPLPVASYGAPITGASQAITAGGTGTAGPLAVPTAGNVTFIVKNTIAASPWAGAPVLVFEQSDDSTSWSALSVVRNDTNQTLSTWTLGAGAANVELMFDAALEGANYVRCRCTTGPTTNGLTIVIQPGGSPFCPVVTTVSSNPSAITGNGPSSVAAAVTDTLILAANANRRGVAVYNDSTAVLYLLLGTAAASTTNFTIKISNAGYYEVPFGYSGMIRGVWSSAVGSARVTEAVA